MQDLVVYGNDFNFMPLPKLSENEMNFFMAIISKLRNNKELSFDFTNFAYDLHLKSNLSTMELENTFYKLAGKMLDFKIKYKTKNKAYAFVCFEKMSLDFNTNELKIIAQQDFFDLINNFQLGFTQFELTEFITISGKYAKNLYRILKQFRTTGKVLIYKNDWQGFCNAMQIPSSYKLGNIDQRILEPCIKELSAEPNLFNNNQGIFKNLTYKKIKDKKIGVGRGGKVIGIEFYFTPEILENIAETKTEQIQEPKSKPKKIAVTETIYFDTEQEKAEYLRNKRNYNFVPLEESASFQNFKKTYSKMTENEKQKIKDEILNEINMDYSDEL